MGRQELVFKRDRGEQCYGHPRVRSSSGGAGGLDSPRVLSGCQAREPHYAIRVSKSYCPHQRGAGTVLTSLDKAKTCPVETIAKVSGVSSRAGSTEGPPRDHRGGGELTGRWRLVGSGLGSLDSGTSLQA